MSAYLIATRWNGQLHHSLEYTKPSRRREHLGTETARVELSDKVAGAGLDVLVRLYFPEAQHGA